MIPIAHFVAVTFYLGAAAIAALPFARPLRAPVSAVVAALLLGVGAHVTALAGLTRQAGAASLTGLGPGLSFAGLVLAISLVIVESLAREVSLTLVAAPLAALVTMAGNLTGMHPFLEPQGTRAVWLTMHIVLSFIGIAAYATAAAAGAMYLVARRELKSAWVGISALALGRLLRGWQAKRAAVMSAVTFASVLALYIVFRVISLNRGQF